MTYWRALTATGKLIAVGVVLLVAVLAVVALYSFVTANPKAEAKLGRNTTEAASQSGQDAVNTVGAAGEREAASDALTRSNEKDIRNAEGANAPVAAPARDAGLRGLCQRRSYNRDPKCLQFTDPR